MQKISVDKDPVAGAHARMATSILPMHDMDTGPAGSARAPTGACLACARAAYATSNLGAGVFGVQERALVSVAARPIEVAASRGVHLWLRGGGNRGNRDRDIATIVTVIFVSSLAT